MAGRDLIACSIGSGRRNQKMAAGGGTYRGGLLEKSVDVRKYSLETMCLKYDFRVLVPFLILLVIWMTEKLHLKNISIKAHPQR